MWCLLLLLLALKPAAAAAAAAEGAGGGRSWLAVDPSFERTGSLRTILSKVTKEHRSPLLRPQHPWEVHLGYVTVIHDLASSKYLAFVAGGLCCNAGPEGGPPRIWDGDCHNDSIRLSSTSLAPPLGLGRHHESQVEPTNCTCHTDTEFLCRPAVCTLGGPAAAPSNAACVALCLASLNKDPLNGCSATTYEAGQCQMSHSPFARPMPKPGSIGCQCADPDKPHVPLRNVNYCSADGAGNSPPLQGVFLSESYDGISFSSANLNQMDYGGMSAFNVIQLNESAGTAPPPFGVQQMSDTNKQPYFDPWDPDPSRRFKMVGNFQRNDSLIPPSTSTVPGFSWPGQNFSWQNYHYGTISSADGRHWHSYNDISMSIDVRADTLNNVVYDPDSKDYMIFSRLDCGPPPFSANPTLKGCSTDGFGLRRLGRSTSKVYGEGSNWSRAEQCVHGEAGDESYNLVPWRDPSWRAGMYLGVASFLNTSGKGNVDHDQYKVRNELLSSGDYGATWIRLAPKQEFIPWGGANSFDSHAIYAAAPFPDPDPAQKGRRLRLYYRASDGPHGNGRSTMGLAYSPPIPAGVTGVGALRTGALETAVNTDDNSGSTQLVLRLAVVAAPDGEVATGEVGVWLLDATTGKLLRSGVAAAPRSTSEEADAEVKVDWITDEVASGAHGRAATRRRLEFALAGGTTLISFRFV